LGISLTAKGVTGEVDTLGGLILAIAGSVPKRGQIIPHPTGVTFEILEAGPKRLHTVRISKQLALPSPDKPLLLEPPGSQEPGLHGAKAA
jgi:CBS domain containing-hemolysin-like protein